MPTIRPHIAKPILIFYCAVLSAIYVFALVNAPLSLLAAAPHDDGLFIELARSLAEAHWLGPYNQFTLAKGPGYPAFLALSHLFGISSSLARALFHCCAVGLFVALCHRYVRSYLLLALLFTLLLWDPASFLGENLRILRDTIYYGQALLSFGFLAHALLGRNPVTGIVAGLMLGWFWLTREEGLWIAAGLGILAAGGIYRAFVERGLLRFFAAGLATVVAFGSVNAGFRAINWWRYGTPVAVEFTEANFVRALGAVHSVRSGGIKPFVSVTRTTRQKIYPVSPAFAELAPHLDGRLGADWARITCFIPELGSMNCGEIGAGVFPWALRDAVAASGYYASPEQAAAFYARVANEIDAACNSKQLECDRQLIAGLPPVTWQQLASLPRHALDAVETVFSARRQSVNGVPTSGSIEQLRADLRLLNYPVIMPPDAKAKTSYVVRGWYYRPGGGWISVSISDKGQPVAVVLERSASPDVAAAFKDSGGSNQRFEIQTFCNSGCLLRVTTDDGLTIERPLAEVTAGTLVIGNGNIFFDSAASELSELFEPKRASKASYRPREAIMRYFEFARIPVVMIGLIAAFGCLLHGRGAMLNPAFVLGSVMWTLAASRIFVIALLDATFVPSLNPVYLAPTGFALTAAAVLSIAAWIELRNAGRSAAAG